MKKGSNGETERVVRSLKHFEGGRENCKVYGWGGGWGGGRHIGSG